MPIQQRYAVIASRYFGDIDYTQIDSENSASLRYSDDYRWALFGYKVTLDENGTVVAGRPGVYNNILIEFTLAQALEYANHPIWRRVPSGSLEQLLQL